MFRHHSIKKALILCLIIFVCKNGYAEKLSEIPIIKLKVETQNVDFVRLDESGAAQILEIKRDVFLLHDYRNVWFIQEVKGELEKKRLKNLPKDSNWYGPACISKDSLIIQLSDYPDDRKDQDDETPRGGFVGGPKFKGYLSIKPFSSLANYSYIESLKIAPKSAKNYKDIDSNNQFYETGVQSCASTGNSMFIGSNGYLGKADFAHGTIELIQNDEELSFNYFPILIDKNDLWAGKDEGGMDGAVLVRYLLNGKTKSFGIDNGEFGIVSYTALVKHQGGLIVGTTPWYF